MTIPQNGLSCNFRVNTADESRVESGEELAGLSRSAAVRLEWNLLEWAVLRP